MEKIKIGYTQDQVQIQRRLRYTDDAFHRVIICLERLEAYIELELSGNIEKLKQTAVNTSRDNHDDNKIIPTKKLLFEELAGQCMVLQMQIGSLKTEDCYNQLLSFFYNDLLEWYGGRLSEHQYDKLDAAIIPIIAALNSQQSDIETIFSKYVAELLIMEDLTEEERRESVIEGWRTIIKVSEHHRQEEVADLSMNDLKENDFILTSHMRGTAVEGYKRIIHALIHLFDDIVLPCTFINTIKTHCPDITEQCPTLNEDYINHLMNEKNNLDQSNENSTKDEEPQQMNEIAVQEKDYKQMLIMFCDKLESLINEIRKNIESDN